MKHTMGLGTVTRGLWLAGVGIILSLGTAALAEDSFQTQLDQFFNEGRWSAAAESAHELLRRQPGDISVRLKGAYALFQKGYPNAALAMLRPITKESWKAIPANQRRLADLLALYQKQVPLTILSTRLEQMDAANASPALRDEILFSQGRALFEEKKYAAAEAVLTQIRKGSRFYSPANYVLGTAAALKKDYKSARELFGRVFDSQVLDQTTEFWKDLGPQDLQKMNSALKVNLDTEVLNTAKRIGELSILGIARVAYAQKDYSTALANYDRISPNSPFYAKARLEKIWTWLSMENHEQAAEAAKELSADDSHFESIQARPIRALVLADAKKTAEAREELKAFQAVYTQFKNSLGQYRKFNDSKALPTFLLNDFQSDTRMVDLKSYEDRLKKEIDALKKEDKAIYPVFAASASELDPLLSQIRNLLTKLTENHIERRQANLETLLVQAKLIAAETFLEDREQLRLSYLGKGATEAEQNAHDEQLVGLLTRAIREVDEASNMLQRKNLALEFRQSELLWELSSATAILTQAKSMAEPGKESAGKTNESKNLDAKAEEYRRRSLQIAQDITQNHPEFPRHAQAMFFTAFALMEIGNDKEALELFRQYIKKYPTHEQVANAYRILGDAEFEKNRYADAEALYRKILDTPNSPIAGYALYKIGWCNYNLRNYAKAMLGLEQAFLWAKSLENTDQLLNLKREARRDLISIYAEIGNHRKAQDYFERFLGGDTSSWLAELAAQLENNGQFEKSTELYERLLSMNPSTEDRIKYQTAIIRGTYQLQDWDRSLVATKDLVENYLTVLEPVQDEFSPAGRAEKILNETVRAQQFEYQSNATPKDIDRILELDKLYLKAFHLWPKSQQPLYQHAHFQLRYGRYQGASEAFIAHWEQFKTTLKEPLREESVRNLVHSLEKVEEQTKEAAGPTSNAAEAIYKYADEYSTNYAQTKYTRPIQFLKATTYFKYKRMEEGIKTSQEIFLADPGDDFGNRAFKNLKVAYYTLKDWKRVYDWSTELANNPKVASTPYLQDLRKIREETLFLWAENTKDNVESAKLYLQISEDPFMQNLRAEALHNAFLRYRDADMRTECLQTAQRLEQANPKFKALPAIAGIRAALYQEAGDYEKALPLYLQFLSQPPKEVDAKVLHQTLLTSALIMEASGNGADATKLYKQYLTITANEKNNDSRLEAEEGLNRIQRQSHRKPASLPPYAEYETLMKMEKELETTPLGKSQNLAQSIQMGAQKLEKTIRRFLEVSSDVRTPGFYAFEAYCTVPFLYGYYQAGIRKLGDGQPDDLKAELEKLAAPLDTQSYELAHKCLDRATEAKHDGPRFRKVLKLWGWAKDENLKKHVDTMIGQLGSNAPWIDPAPVAMDEKQILQLHLQKKDTADTWYTLAKTRMDQNQLGLSRLTFMATLVKEPNSPRVLNALAVLDQMNGVERNAVAPLFQKAMEEGSGLAAANLALIQLSGARLKEGMAVLSTAEDKGGFAKTPEVLAAYKALEAYMNAPQEAAVETKTEGPTKTPSAQEEKKEPAPNAEQDKGGKG